MYYVYYLPTTWYVVGIQYMNIHLLISIHPKLIVLISINIMQQASSPNK